MKRDPGFPAREVPGRGQAALFALLVLTVLLGIFAFGLDIGAQLLAKQQAIGAAENAAHRGAAEMFDPDYEPTGGIADDRWFTTFNEADFRGATRDLAGRNEAGWNPDGSVYHPDVHLNNDNLANGDIRMGRWERSGRSFVFNPSPADVTDDADIPRAAETTVRRTQDPEIPGVREGANPVPFIFGRINAPGSSGLDVHTRVRVNLVPAAVIGRGTLVPTYGGGTAVTGVMPMRLRQNRRVRRWIRTADPTDLRTFRIQRRRSRAGQIDFSDFTGGGDARVLRTLRWLGQRPTPFRGRSEPPPRVALDSTLALERLSRVNFFTAFRILRWRFLRRTWILPVTRRGRIVVGFLRVYCEDVIDTDLPNEMELELRLAVSACARNSGTITSRARMFDPPSLPSGRTLKIWSRDYWESARVGSDDFYLGGRLTYYGARPYGGVCATVTVDYPD